MKKLLWSDFCELTNEPLDDLDDLEGKLPGISINDVFNLYVLKTNFGVTEEDGYAISSLDGVEVVSFISKYQVVIGIGELFDKKEVQESIKNTILYPDSFNKINQISCEETKNLLLERREEVSCYKHWAILMAPNGNMKSVFSDEFHDYLTQKEKLSQSNLELNGIVITSES